MAVQITKDMIIGDILQVDQAMAALLMASASTICALTSPAWSDALQHRIS